MSGARGTRQRSIVARDHKASLRSSINSPSSS